MDYKKAFYSKLEDCYLGAKIKDTKDKSGFGNLLSIKERYFEHIKQILDKRIPSTDDFDEHEIYNKLYTFFDSYLNETGTPFFTDTPIYKNIYAKIYSNSKDTSLFYKTQNLYYVKSDVIYKSMTLSDENAKFAVEFNADEFRRSSDNVKSKLIFKFAGLDQGANLRIQTPLIKINVTNQSELFKDLKSIFKQGSGEFTDDFLKEIKPLKIDKDELKKILRSYKKQNEVDFFIHKDAENFLKEQFELWMFSHLYGDSKTHKWQSYAIERLQKIRNIAFELIEIIAKFENELKAIWLKPKFAKNTQYVFTLDLIPNFDVSLITDKQIAEWKELNLVDVNFTTDTLKTEFEKFKFLPLDTKFLSDKNRLDLLSRFENLDEILNGELVKSDNFAALNTLMPRYKGKIDLIYIDPPFNTGSDFEYKDRFQDATWLTLMQNRLELAREILSDRGSFYLHLDENADFLGRMLLDEIFNFDECKKITFDTNATKDEEADLFGYKSFGNNFALKSSTIFFIKNGNSIFNKLWKPNRNISQLNLGQLDLIAVAKTNCPKKIKDYNFLIERYENDKLKLQSVDISNEKIYPVGDIWNDIYFFTQSEMRVSENISFYSSQKPEHMIRRIVQASSNQNNLVLDFFTGSGTTCSVAHKLKRRWIGIEMGNHFYEKYLSFNKESKTFEYRLGLLGRMKNVLAGDKSFFAMNKSRRSSLSNIIGYKGGGAFRYYELESYEEALNECEYALDENGVIDYRRSRKLIKKLNKGEKVCLDMVGYRGEFDIFLSYSNLTGAKIKRIFARDDVECAEFENGEIMQKDDIDMAKFPKIRDLIWWER